VHVYGNTHYYGKGAPEIMGPNLHRTPIETVFNNNIFFSESPGGNMGVNAENGANVVYDTNVYYNITPPASEQNALTSNPVFVSPGAEPYDLDMRTDRHLLGGYRLCTGSPSIGSGIEISDKANRDFWGDEVRSANIGAYGGHGVSCKEKAQLINPRHKKKIALVATK